MQTPTIKSHRRHMLTQRQRSMQSALEALANSAARLDVPSLAQRMAAAKTENEIFIRPQADMDLTKAAWLDIGGMSAELYKNPIHTQRGAQDVITNRVPFALFDAYAQPLVGAVTAPQRDALAVYGLTLSLALLTNATMDKLHYAFRIGQPNDNDDMPRIKAAVDDNVYHVTDVRSGHIAPRVSVALPANMLSRIKRNASGSKGVTFSYGVRGGTFKDISEQYDVSTTEAPQKPGNPTITRTTPLKATPRA